MHDQLNANTTTRTSIQFLIAVLTAATLLALTATSSGAAVIGGDARIRVSPTTSFPASTIVYIEVRDDMNRVSRCSGTMISKDTVATAAHCVWDWSAKKYFRIATMNVIPALNGFDANRRPVTPYQQCKARSIWAAGGYRNNAVFSAAVEHDYGAIKLDCTVGLQTGVMKLYAPTAPQIGETITAAGYPKYKSPTPAGCWGTIDNERLDFCQWKHTDKIVAVTARRIGTNADVTKGQSGGPVYQNRAAGQPGCVGYCMLAIISQEPTGDIAYNRATRVTPTVIADLTAIVKQV